MDFLLGRQGWCDIQVTLFMPFNCAKHELFAFPLLRLVILELSSEKMVVGPLEIAPIHHEMVGFFFSNTDVKFLIHKVIHL